MATRYGRRIADDTYEYHDSKESLLEAQRRENRSDRAGLFGLIGLLVGGMLSYFLVHKWGADWPKSIKLGLVIIGGGALSYAMAKLADLIWDGIKLLILFGVLYGLGHLIWKAL